MKSKLIAVLFASVVTTGCASNLDKVVSDFHDGASASSESRESRESNSAYAKKRDDKKEFVNNVINGVLTAFMRGIFDLDSSDDN